ncbi:MAG: hypothetical protein KTR22_00175, partial [Flavobacteriaceae bacterium]|nr:hypothetical protein [Flavobacteriaceae bacterium]
MNEGINDIYVKAFNQAYLLAKFNVSLLDKILSSNQEGNYFDGLRDGKKTFEQERARQRQK